MTIRQVDDWHDWLVVERGDAPLVLSVPHAGTRLPGEIESRLVSPWLARKDTDWYVDRLYSFAGRARAPPSSARSLSRTVIDVNRDPEGRSLYPGQATTELCPTTTFDGEPLYPRGRRARCARDRGATRPLLRALPRRDLRRDCAVSVTRMARSCCSMRTRSARSCRGSSKARCRCSISGRIPDVAARRSLSIRCRRSAPRAGCRPSSTAGSRVATSRATMASRTSGVHAVQLELAMRGYLDEPTSDLREGMLAAAVRASRRCELIRTLRRVVEACVVAGWALCK